MGLVFCCSLIWLLHLIPKPDVPVEVPYPPLWESLIHDGMKMNKIKKLIQDFDRTKDAFQKLLVLGTIQNELEAIKKDLSKKIK